MKVAIYLRISQDANEDGLAHARQLADCERLVKARGWSDPVVFRDTVSASKRHVTRPDYDRMVAAFSAGEFDALVCWDLDRLTRQPRQLEDWVDLAEERALTIVTANGEADLSTDAGRMFARIKAAVAKQEVERKSARQKAKNLQLIAEGKPVPGRRRFGYEGDNMTPRESEAAVVRAIFASFLEDDKHTIRALAQEYGRRTGWIREVLTNRAYCGEVKHQGIYYPSEQITPLVSTEDMDNAAAFLEAPSRKTSPGGQPKHLLSGIAVCGECGAFLSMQRDYRCRISQTHVSIQKSTLEDVVVNGVLQWLVNGAEDVRGESANLLALQKESAEVEAARAHATSLALVPGVDMKLVTVQLAELGKRAEVIRGLIEAERANATTAGFVAQMKESWSGEFKGKVVAALAFGQWWSTLTLDAQRDVVRAAFSMVTVQKGRAKDRVKLLTDEKVSTAV